MNDTLTPPAPRPASADTTTAIADGDQHATDGTRPLRAWFEITSAGRLVWADR